MTATLLTGIGLLATQDDELGELKGTGRTEVMEILGWLNHDKYLFRPRKQNATETMDEARMRVSKEWSQSFVAWAGADGVVEPSRRVERDGWPILDVIDRRDDEPGRTGLYSERLVRLLRSDQRVVCVLNRRGRARLMMPSGGESETGRLEAFSDGVLAVMWFVPDRRLTG